MEFEQLGIGGTGAMQTRTRLTDDISYDYIYCDSTYSGLYIGSLKQIIERKQSFLDNAKKKALQLKPEHEPYILVDKEQDKYPGVLKTRRCIAGLVRNTDKDDKVIHVIWFDDGDTPVEESLRLIIPSVDWEQALEFDY